YRTRRDARAINEIASTLVCLFAAIGFVAFAGVAVVAWQIGPWFDLDLERTRTGAIVMLLVAAQFAIGMPFAIYGAVVNGFQRQYLDAVVATIVAIAVAAVNVGVVLGGGTLIQLVAAMTATRLIGYLAYRLNAYRVFP